MKYSSATSLLEKGKYTEAQKKFEDLGKYKDSPELAKEADRRNNYQKAEKAFDNGDYIEAEALFKKADPYKDSTQMVKKCLVEQALVDANDALSKSDSETALNAIKGAQNATEAKEDIKRVDECLSKVIESALGANKIDTAKEAADLISDKSVIAKETQKTLDDKIKKQEEEKKAAEAADAYDLLSGLYISDEGKVKEAEELLEKLPADYKDVKHIKEVIDFYKPYVGKYYGGYYSNGISFVIRNDSKEGWVGDCFKSVKFIYPNKTGTKDDGSVKYEVTLVDTKKIEIVDTSWLGTDKSVYTRD